MKLLQTFAYVIIAIYIVVVIILYVLQTKLIFYPGKLLKDFRFKLGDRGEEVFIETDDGENINGLFYPGFRDEVILYFHGNAGDLSGWQFVTEDFTDHGYNVLIIDYRGYGKSSGYITEAGLYKDATSAYHYLLTNKNFTAQNIVIYGRSIGSGVAVELASKYSVKGLVLESPYSSLKKLANEKFPFLFPSLYLKFHFDNIQKIKDVKSPVILIHGGRDTIIPASHSEILVQEIKTKKELILIPDGEHNDLNTYERYQHFLKEVLPRFFQER